MARKTILFNGGLVTSRDPSLLQSNDRIGELTLATDAEYQPNDPAIWPVGGRSPFNATAEASPILSAGMFEFDGGTAKIIALVGSSYRIADLGLTGTFSDLLTGLTGSAKQFDQVHFRNQHLIVNGVDRNRVVSSDGTTAPQGMLANVSAPTLSRDAGVLSGITLSTGNTITYWLEEQIVSGTTILRRSGCAAAQTVTLTGDGTTDKPVITFPTPVNADATHWGLYATETNGSFPTGALIAQVPIATTSQEETRTGSNPSLPSGDTYPTVAVELGGVVTTVPKYGQAPIASTCDVFEGSIVTNDVANEAHIRFSFPDDIDAWPSINLINIRTKVKDKVVFVRTLGRSCIVGMSHGLWRIDTLPLPEDASFQTDRIKTEIEGAFGAVSPLAIAKFSIGETSLLAYVSAFGLVVTDGTGWSLMSLDLDWESTVDVPTLANSVLVNNARMYRLELYLPVGAYYFHYHPSHLKPTRGSIIGAKVTGPISVNAKDAFFAPVAADSQEHYVWTAQADGKLYREGVGTADLSGGSITFKVRTGDIYFNGVGGEATFRRGWVHHSAGATTQKATLRQRFLCEGEAIEETEELLDVSRREATGAYVEGLADAHQFAIEMTNPAQRVRFDYFVADTEAAGEEQSP